jgi:hypothetical protein
MTFIIVSKIYNLELRLIIDMKDLYSKTDKTLLREIKLNNYMERDAVFIHQKSQYC